MLCQAILVAALSITVQACTTPLDCELNGKCVAGDCVCSSGWRGPVCGQLDLAPLPADATVGWVPEGGDPATNVSCSWGGNLIQNPKGAPHRWSLIAAAMQGHCGIDSWTTNSEVALAVGDSPFGPFRYVKTLVPRFAHEPNVIRANNGSLVMFYAGCGGCDMPPAPSCAPPVPKPWPWSISQGVRTDQGTLSPKHPRHKQHAAWPPRGLLQTWLTVSPSGDPSGPWSAPMKLDVGDACVETDLDTNFNAAIMANGTLIGLWRCVETLNTTQPGATVIHTVRAEQWDNPSTYDFSPHPAYPQREFGTEDPFVWIAADGTVHAILHDEDECCPPARDTALGKHAFSDDGITWHLSESYAYNGTVQVDDGSTHDVVRRERPHLMVGATGAPLFLTNGVQSSHSSDWTFTLVQAVRTAPR